MLVGCKGLPELEITKRSEANLPAEGKGSQFFGYLHQTCTRYYGAAWEMSGKDRVGSMETHGVLRCKGSGIRSAASDQEI